MLSIKGDRNSFINILKSRGVEIYNIADISKKEVEVEYLLAIYIFDIKKETEWIKIIIKRLKEVGFIFKYNQYKENNFKGKVILESRILYRNTNNIRIIIDNRTINALKEDNSIISLRFKCIYDIYNEYLLLLDILDKVEYKQLIT